MFRSSAVALSLALASPALGAESPCDGAYAEAGELVDAAIGKYGTLYSGGSHWRYLDTVGATLDLYRLWLGLPDIALRSVEPPHWREEGFDYGWNEVSGEEIWTQAGGLVTAAEDGDRKTRLFAAWGHDALTSAGPAPDWWLHAEDFPTLTPTQRWVAEIIPTAPVLDWLQVLLVASSTPEALFDHLDSADPDPALATLADHAWSQHAPESGPAWAVASALVQPERTERIDAWLAQLEQDVLACQASASDYAAWAIVVHGQDRLTPDPEGAAEASRLALLPPATRGDLLDQRLMRQVFRGDLPADLSWWRNQLPGSGRIAYVSALSAATPAELPPPEHAAVVRLLNGLSSADLSVYSEAHDADAWLAPVLYGRAIALGDWQGAEDLLPRLAATSEDTAAALKTARAVRGSREAKLARVALHLDTVQLHICGGDTGADYGLWIYQGAYCGDVELPPDYAQGAAFDRDLEVFLRVPSRWGAFSGMHGMSIPSIERMLTRRGPLEIGTEVASPTVTQGDFPISSQLDLTVADAASGVPLLMPRVAATIIQWAEAQSDTPRKQRSRRITAVAESLGMLVRRCRYAPCGAVDGRPAQQVAFELLHRRMAETEAAKETPIWWYSPAE